MASAGSGSGVSPGAGIVLRSHIGTRYRFDAGALSLEVLTTGGPGDLARHEALRTPDDLVAWAERSRLTPTPALDITDDDVADARRLRDALFRTVVTRVRGDGLPGLDVSAAGPADLDVINRAAARPPLAPALGPDGTRHWAPETATGAQLLSTTARDAVDLLTGPYADRIRMCSGERCYLVFADTSRPGRRRWCSMENCGNRHKVRAHRARGNGA